jgi:hypothetical protein
LNGGYHLAYVLGAALVVAAIAVALTVLQPAPSPAAAQLGEAEFVPAQEAYAEAS